MTLTYVSEARGSTSWMDYVMCSKNMHSLIKHVCILDRPLLLDHLPPLFIDIVPSKNIRYSDKKIINWSQSSNYAIAKKLTK